MRRVLAAAVVALCTLVTVTACSDDSGGNSGEGGTTETETIELTFSGDTVTPSGERVEVDVDQPIDLVVTADAPGEIHVHSTPEETFPYSEGETTIELQIGRPGIVEVESHDLELTIVQLEAS